MATEVVKPRPAFVKAGPGDELRWGLLKQGCSVTRLRCILLYFIRIWPDKSYKDEFGAVDNDTIMSCVGAVIEE